jgi:membrane-bound lytic murein transglycosylase F
MQPTAALTVSIYLCIALAVMGCSDQSLYQRLERDGELILLTRNSPTTYYFDGDEATGFDYDLIKGYADSRNYTLRVKAAFTLEELITRLAKGEAHLAAAGLTVTPERSARFLASDPYLTQKPLVVYKSGQRRPRDVSELANRDLVVLAGSSHTETLLNLQKQHPQLAWREIRAADTLELMQLVTTGKAELAIIDSVEFRMQQQLYPRLVAALELDKQEVMAWYLHPAEGADAMQADLNAYLSEIEASGDLQKLKDRHFGTLDFASRLSTFTFRRKLQTDLPRWQSLIEEVADEYQLDWRLLAAIAYQESHWDPEARSPTGVRGLMMITQVTAEELGVDDVLDPHQSLRGGARFLKDLQRRLPPDIEDPHRLWMALAAYNIGMGHLEDARILAERKGMDPHLWPDVRAQLPSLQNPDVYPTTRFGFARGQEAVTYVDNIRQYYSILQLQSVPDSRLQPPVDTNALSRDQTRLQLPKAL